jgi:predicted site-specific integrase-resolvase
MLGLRPERIQARAHSSTTRGHREVSQRTAIYCRVSTADQSCQRQERDLLDYTNRHQLDVIGIFRETASGSRNDRTVR